jgi:BRCT domain type II-containing protein
MISTVDCCVGITGTLKTMSVETAIRHIHEAGCSYVSDISVDTSCLVVGESPDARIMAKAAQLKIFVVWEDQFLERLVSSRCRKH